MALAEGVVAAIAVAVAVAAGWQVVPRPVSVEGERWFKAMLVEAGVEGVPFRPGVRRAEELVRRPHAAAPDEDPAAVAAVSRAGSVPDRWAWFLDGAAARLAPDGLGAVHDPRRWLGPGWGWDAVRALGRGDDRLAREVERRLGATWATVRGTEDPLRVGEHLGVGVAWDVGLRGSNGAALGAALGLVLRDAAGLPWPSSVGLVGACLAWAEHLATRLAVDGVVAGLREAAGAGRLLVAATGEGAPMLARALADDMDLRDRVLAVVAVAAPVVGVPGRPGVAGEAACRDWMEANFRHESLDNELLRRIPWCSIEAASFSGEECGLPPGHMRWPAPSFVGGGRMFQPREAEVIDTVDLGVLDLDRRPVPAVLAAVIRAQVGLQARARG